MRKNRCKERGGRSVFDDALELTAVIALVFAIGWFGTRIARAAHRLPVGPSPDGVVNLRIAKSDRRGDVTFEEGENYAGWWHCAGDWMVEWRVAPASAGAYRVKVLVSFPDKKVKYGIKVRIADQEFMAASPNPGDPSKWADLDLGVVLLEAKPYSLTVQPMDPAPRDSLNVKSASLQLVPSDTK